MKTHKKHSTCSPKSACRAHKHTPAQSATPPSQSRPAASVAKPAARHLPERAPIETVRSSSRLVGGSLSPALCQRTLLRPGQCGASSSIVVASCPRALLGARQLGKLRSSSRDLVELAQVQQDHGADTWSDQRAHVIAAKDSFSVRRPVVEQRLRGLG